jgi:hypothetical protein
MLVAAEDSLILLQNDSPELATCHPLVFRGYRLRCGAPQDFDHILTEGNIFTHLVRRETQRRDAGAATRFGTGDGELLLTIREMSRLLPVNLSIYIVQPGASQANVTDGQPALMSVTEHYLSETYQLRFAVIASR